MILADLENACLSQLLTQSPPPNFGGVPAWSSFPGSKFSQGMVDNAINRSINRLTDDMGNMELLRFAVKFTSVAQQFSYPIPPVNSAQGALTLTGTIASGVTFTITIGGVVISYTSTTSDASLAQLFASLTNKINASTAVTGGVIIVPVTPAGNAANTFTITAAQSGAAGNAVTLVSTTNSGTLLLTASGATLTGGTALSPAIKTVTRVRYNPQGLPYVRDMVPGAKMISYADYEQCTGAGYLQPYSFGTEPQVCTIAPSRKELLFYPGPNTTGDLITFEYVPVPTAGTGVPLLAAATDVPFGIPEDWYDAIWMGALWMLWMVSRESGAAQEYHQMYLAEVERLKTNWRRTSTGDGARIQSSEDVWDNIGIGSFGATWR